MISLEIDIIYELSPSAWNKKGFFLQTDFLKRETNDDSFKDGKALLN
ncbi:hypothetical protein CHCC14821_2669 [Bacillus paralicheniformis]|nr:hypothetical protein CHCC14821_2669 [Bacillus paralicheniformis]